jgi:hypothetical protein
MNAEDSVPDVPPFVITITWTPGDSIHIDTGGLFDWEVDAALQAAVDTLAEKAAAEAENEADA